MGNCITIIRKTTYLGETRYYKNGKLHRDGGLPAIIKRNRRGEHPVHKEWWVNGQCHRDNDLPAIERANGDREWWVNGKRHRDNGPAVERSNGTREWWFRGMKMRVDKDLNRKRPENVFPPQEEEPDLPQEVSCVVCMNRRKVIAFLPCGHVSCCTVCSPKIEKCPICTDVPDQKTMIYM